MKAGCQFSLQLPVVLMLALAALVGWPSIGRCQLPSRQQAFAVNQSSSEVDPSPCSNIEVLASGIHQARASLVENDNELFFLDSGDLKKISTTGGAIIPLAQKVVGPENLMIQGGQAFWIDGDRLYKTSLDQRVTTLIAKGMRDPISGATAEIAADDTSVFWVNTVQPSTCSPSCNWIIQKVPIDGGVPITLVHADKKIVSLTSDTNNIYWEEKGVGPITFPDGPEGSTIKRISKAGGDTTILVNGALNGLIEPPPPPYLAASWGPTGGITVKGSEVFFSDGRIMKVPITGGPITVLWGATTDLIACGNCLLSITIDATNIYWIDTCNSTLNTIPVNGGSVTTLASGLSSPNDLAVTPDAAFWTEPGTVPETGSIRKVPLAGGSASTVVGGLFAPSALVVDSSGLYWAEVWRLAQSPGDQVTPITTLASGIASELARIAVDDQFVYILDGFIKKVPINGGIVEMLTTQVGFGGLGLTVSLGDLSQDASNLYWTLHGVWDSTGVYKIPKTGGSVVTLSGTLSVSSEDCIRRVAVDGKNVYWTSSSISHYVGCAINKVSIDGGPMTTILDGAMLDWAVDGKDIYFSHVELFNVSLNKVSIDGGTISFLSTLGTLGALSPGIALIVDDLNVYWCCGIGKVSKAGGAPTYLPGFEAESDSSGVEAIAVDESNIYWTETLGGTIKKATAAMPPPALIIGASSLSEGEVGVDYDASLAVTGGMCPYRTGAIKGALPSGLNFDNFDSPKISGVPARAGSKSFTVRVMIAPALRRTRT